MPKEKRFYHPEDFEPTMKKMDKILWREGKSLSLWIREQIREYVRLHEPGNPQQLMERYQNHDGPYYAGGPCSFVGCSLDASWIGEYKGEKHYVCARHRRKSGKSRSWSGWREL